MRLTVVCEGYHNGSFRHWKYGDIAVGVGRDLGWRNIRWVQELIWHSAHSLVLGTGCSCSVRRITLFVGVAW